MVIRVFVEKKPGFDVEARHMKADLRENLGLTAIEDLRLFNRYDVDGLSPEEFDAARGTIFSEPNVDNVYGEDFAFPADYQVFAMEYLPGQYDQRADSAAQCVQLLTQKERPQVLTARVVAIKGSLSPEEMDKIKSYLVNPVESRLASMDKPQSLDMKADVPADVARVTGFNPVGRDGNESLFRLHGLCHDPGRPSVLPGLLPGPGAPGPHRHRAAGHRHLLERPLPSHHLPHPPEPH